MRNSDLSRRRFMAAVGSGLASLPLLPAVGFAQNLATADGNILILVELAGGNDGLNTVIPIKNPTYRLLRPEIGLHSSDTLTLDADTGLHPSMRAAADLWERGEMQIIEGVGYPDPNRSHFRSIEIWNAGLGAQTKTTQGWISHAFDNEDHRFDTDADGLVLGGEMGPLAGQGRFSAMRDEEQFLDTLQDLSGMQHPVRPATHRTPLAHVLATYENAQITGDAIRRKLEASRERQWHFPQTDLGQQLRTAARLLDAGVTVPVLKVVQDGYDTHDAQPDQHAALLQDLSDAIDSFAAAMRDIGLWENVTILTYSEFGRTARENASAGTDHGTAAPVFAMGGRVRGGLSGKQPSLDALVDGDLAHTTDYRDVYRAVLTDLWGIRPTAGLAGDGSDIQLLG
ncbi:DUF1501 domain-containing protein [Yoonia sp. SS1-5]|uniref:DUF1501 domain-containing protein n=1 Tax=Yoonia rhodophyticola TaxID=3137370 RepID=A0AAN0MAT1_9RHOB